MDSLAAVVDWVENGRAPAELSAVFAGEKEATRKICPYPKHAAYTGTGFVDDVGSWICQ
jgi:hypothetical protein